MMSYVLAILAAILWGVAPIFDKIVISAGVSLYLANLIRAMGAVSFLSVTVIYFKHFDLSQLTAKYFLYLFIAGMLAGGLAMVLYYTALKYEPASRIIPLTSIYPLFTIAISAIALGENLSMKVIVGTILIIIGVALVCSEQ